jgi:TP901 family phage tail tape measure protein
MTFIGTAVIAAGVAATKLSLDYSDAFTKISAVSNASAEDVAKWKGEVLDLAGKTAQAPKELADALFFLASAGLKTSQIMPTLEASAKASAAGLGETADVAKLTANVLNAYAGSGIKAANVTDILVAAVREGSADTDEFGTAIGRILPIASTAGITFDSVAASLASLSNVGLDVNEGVTAMRGLIQALVSPSATAATALEGMGLSSQTLLDSLQQNGLIATLRLLTDTVKKFSPTQADFLENMRVIVPNVRALTGMLGLTTQQAEKVDAIFKRVKDSTGSLDEAFKTTAESAGFKLRQALAQIEVVAIRLGDLILPVLATIASFLATHVGPAFRDMGQALGDAWATMQPVVQGLVEWFKKVWDAIGPVVKSMGRDLVEAATQIFSVLQSNLGPMLSALWDLLKKLWELFKPLIIVIGIQLYIAFKVITEVLPVLIAIITKLIEWLARIIEGALAVVTFFRDKFIEPIINVFGRIIDVVGNVIGWIKDRFVDAWQFILGPIKAVIDRILGWINDIKDAIEAAVGWLAKLTSGIGPVTENPRGRGAPGAGLQHGGEVLSTGMALVHKGEVFSGVNNEMGFGGGLTVIINGDVTGEEVVRKVRDGLLKLKARNATTGL